MDHEITPELDAFIAASLDHWTSFGPTDNGFSIAASAIMNQMIPGRDARAWSELNKAWGLPNLGKATFYWESDHCPVNESPFGLAAALQYMLLRSDTGNIDVFPQRVEALRNASFASMRAEGGFVVSAVLKELRTQWVEIESLLGNECLLRVRDWRDVAVAPSVPVEKRG